MWGGGRRHAAQQQSTAATVHSGAITNYPSGWITIVDVVTLPDRNQLNTTTVQRRHLRHIEAVAALIFSKAIVSFSLVLEAKVWIGKNKNNNKSFSRQPVSFCGKSCNFFSIRIELVNSLFFFFPLLFDLLNMLWILFLVTWLQTVCYVDSLQMNYNAKNVWKIIDELKNSACDSYCARLCLEIS